MKKLFYFCIAIILMSTGCDNASNKKDFEISTDKIYFFYSNSCPHCHDALEYINKKYPNLKLSMVNVGTAEGYNLLIKCAQDFNLGNQIGTPFFCMGDKQLMGWSPQLAKRFDQYVIPFLK